MGTVFVRRGGRLCPPCHSEPVTDVTGVGIRNWLPCVKGAVERKRDWGIVSVMVLRKPRWMLRRHSRRDRH